MDRLGRFELLRKLGAGATAEVYLANGPNPKGAELVALKVLLQHLSEDDLAREEFLKEGRVSLSIHHPNVVELYEVGEDDGRPWLAMELVRGWSLSALLKRFKASNAKLEPDEACEAVRQAALGLHHAHELSGPNGPLGLVHRDVSPQNLIVSDTGVVKVADFGLAKATAQSVTVTRGIKGKLRYLPPEQLRGESLDRRADVFALGAVLWELTCGQALYPGQSEAEVFQQAAFASQPHPDEVAKGLSRALVDVLVRSVERDLKKRMGSALELAQALEPLTQGAASAERLGAAVRLHGEPLPKTIEEARSGASLAKKPAAILQAFEGSLTSPAPLEDPGQERTVLAQALDLSQSHGGETTVPFMGPVRSLASESIDLEQADTVSGLLADRAHAGPELALPQDTMADPVTIERAMHRGRRGVRGGVIIGAAVLLFAAAVGLGRLLFSTPKASVTELPLDPRLQAPSGPAPRPKPLPPQPTPAVPQPVDAESVAKKPGPPKAQGFVIIDSREPAVVEEGGVDRGLTGQPIALSAGAHVLTVATPDGSAKAKVSVVVKAGRTVRKPVKLEPKR